MSAVVNRERSTATPTQAARERGWGRDMTLSGGVVAQALESRRFPQAAAEGQGGVAEPGAKQESSSGTPGVPRLRLHAPYRLLDVHRRCREPDLNLHAPSTFEACPSPAVELLRQAKGAPRVDLPFDEALLADRLWPPFFGSGGGDLPPRRAGRAVS